MLRGGVRRRRRCENKKVEEEKEDENEKLRWRLRRRRRRFENVVVGGREKPYGRQKCSVGSTFLAFSPILTYHDPHLLIFSPRSPEFHLRPFIGLSWNSLSS